MGNFPISIAALLISVATGVLCFYVVSKSLAASILLAIFAFAVTEVLMSLYNYTQKLGDQKYKDMYESFKRHGILEYYKDFSSIDFSKCIDASRHIKLYLIYSHRFLTNNLTALRDFVERDGTSLEIIILTSDTSKSSFSYTCEKFNYTSKSLNQRLDEFIRVVKDEIVTRKHERSSIAVYQTIYIPTYTLYMFDDYAYITIYKSAPERTNLIPSFRVEESYDSSLFHFLETDFNNVKSHSTTKKFCDYLASNLRAKQSEK